MTVILYLILIIVWLVSLARWDGTIPCDPEDCADCQHGKGCCEHEAHIKARKETENKETEAKEKQNGQFTAET